MWAYLPSPFPCFGPFRDNRPVLFSIYLTWGLCDVVWARWCPNGVPSSRVHISLLSTVPTMPVDMVVSWYLVVLYLGLNWPQVPRAARKLELRGLSPSAPSQLLAGPATSSLSPMLWGNLPEMAKSRLQLPPVSFCPTPPPPSSPSPCLSWWQQIRCPGCLFLTGHAENRLGWQGPGWW